MEHPFLMCLDHTQRRTTVGRTSDLYLTTHNTHNRKTSMPPVGFEPTNSASDLRLRPRGHWDRHSELCTERNLSVVFNVQDETNLVIFHLSIWQRIYLREEETFSVLHILEDVWVTIDGITISIILVALRLHIAFHFLPDLRVY